MTYAHLLDRPVWNALTTRQSHVAQGNARAVRFAPDHSLFAATADSSDASLAALSALLPASGHVWIVEAEAISVPAGATVISQKDLHQMIAPAIIAAPTSFTIQPLTEADAPAMQALAALTEPGPFFARAHRLGDFVGVKEDGRLVAMAGERMKPEGFTEVSGVCTHPDFRGRGYAGGLMRTVAERIIERGETPFLHAYSSNTGAIALYETLGFILRRTITMTTLAKADAGRA